MPSACHFSKRTASDSAFQLGGHVFGGPVGHVDVVGVRELAQPGELALGVAAGLRRAWPRRRRRSSSSKPSALRAVGDAWCSCAFCTSSRTPASSIASMRASMRRYSASRSIVSAASSVGWRVSARPQLRRRVRGRRGLVAGLDAARAPGGCAGGPWARSRFATVGRQRGVERFDGARVVGPASADRRVDGRSEVELGQRRPQVQAGAADDDRAPAVFEQLVDRRVRVSGVGPGGERRVDRDEAEQAVLEPALFLARSPRR